MMQKPYGVRSDLHGRVDLFKRHADLLRTGNIAGIFDLGDIEVSYIDENHPLRAGQTLNEQTMDTIARNSFRDGQLTPVAVEAISQTLASLEVMKALSNSLGKMHPAQYRVIAGNGEEAWTMVFGRIANPAAQAELARLFAGFDLIRESTAEFYRDGQPISSDALQDGARPETGIIYLPWKSPIDKVQEALSALERYDPARIIIMSHDYLTRASLDTAIRDEIKPMQNEEQIVEVLDRTSQIGGEVTGYFGHIGLQYGTSEVSFQHRRKTIKALHTDERDGTLLELRL